MAREYPDISSFSLHKILDRSGKMKSFNTPSKHFPIPQGSYLETSVFEVIRHTNILLKNPRFFELGIDKDNNRHVLETNNILKFHGMLFMQIMVKMAKPIDNAHIFVRTFEVNLSNDMVRAVFIAGIDENDKVIRTTRLSKEEFFQLGNGDIDKALKHAIDKLKAL